jgi:hypothetical protein
MMMATFTAVATPHALVLTVSHGLLFRQPLFVAAAPMPPFLATEHHFAFEPSFRSYHLHGPMTHGMTAAPSS